jgi:hypothetical protein
MTQSGRPEGTLKKENYEPNNRIIWHRSLRRTLVLVNGEWSMVNKVLHNLIDYSTLTKKVPNAQVSDTTGDAQRFKSRFKKILYGYT